MSADNSKEQPMEKEPTIWSIIEKYKEAKIKFPNERVFPISAVINMMEEYAKGKQKNVKLSYNCQLCNGLYSNPMQKQLGICGKCLKSIKSKQP